MGLFPLLVWLSLLMVPAASAQSTLRESSGLAVGAHGLLWAHNDGPNIGDKTSDRHLYALGTKGDIIARVKVGARNSDWEDLAAFSDQGRNYLLIADTGDNLERRKESQLYVVEEPAGDSAEAKVAWKIRFRYPDKAHDCEAVAVDHQRKRVLLVTKRGTIPEIFSLPLRPGKEVQTATLLGTMWPLPQSPTWDRVTHPLLGRYTHEPTGIDLSRDGRLAVVVTYDDAYLWRRKRGESWEQALAREPDRIIVLPGIRQYEGVAFSRDARSIYVSEEGSGAVIVVSISQ